MKYVLLTGASGGLGLNLSKYLLEQGYYVIMLYHTNKDKVEELHNQYKNSMVYKIDLRNDIEIDNLNRYLIDNDINVDILINNAAIDHTSEVENKNKETFFDVFELNTYVPFKLMETINYKAVINISSENTIDTYDEVSMEYDVSKAGLNMLSNIYRKRFSNRIINTIAFGWLDTNMNDIPDDVKQYIEFVPFDKACSEIVKLFDKQVDDIVIVRK
jgi:short-subunit dehydrogenase